MLLPKDPNDERNIFLEIRAGTGGDESALFAGDLFRMYSRYAERQGWQVEVISESPGDVGGYKEIIARIIGHGAYSKLKFESGGHRVQRVPGNRDSGPHPHLGLHGRGPARGRRDRRRRAEPGRHAHRHFPRFRRRRPARQQDRLRGADHAPPDGHRGGVPGRRARSTRTRKRRSRVLARAHQGQADARAAGEGGRDAQVASSAPATAPSASAPTISRKAGSPTTASASPSTRSTTSWTATSPS